MRETLSIVISSYNEEGNVAELHRRLAEVARSLPVRSVEYIFVDDGSTDGTLLRCHELQRSDPNVKIVRLFRNFGHETAMMAGMDCASGDAVIFMDADLQHPPERIGDMVGLWRDGHDIVLTRRTDNAASGPFYRLCARAFYRAVNFLSDIPIPANTPDFRLIGRKYVDILKAFDERGMMFRGILGWVTPLDNAAIIEFAAPRRLSGESKYTFRKSMALAVDAVVQFSVKPLFLSMWLTGIVAVFAVVLGLQVVVERYVLQNPTPGFATIVLTTLIMGTINLVVLTIMCAYIAKIHVETKKRPLYAAEFITADGEGRSARDAGTAAAAQERRE